MIHCIKMFFFSRIMLSETATSTLSPTKERAVTACDRHSVLPSEGGGVGFLATTGWHDANVPGQTKASFYYWVTKQRQQQWLYKIQAKNVWNIQIQGTDEKMPVSCFDIFSTVYLKGFMDAIKWQFHTSKHTLTIVIITRSVIKVMRDFEKNKLLIHVSLLCGLTTWGFESLQRLLPCLKPKNTGSLRLKYEMLLLMTSLYIDLVTQILNCVLQAICQAHPDCNP